VVTVVTVVIVVLVVTVIIVVAVITVMTKVIVVIIVIIDILVIVVKIIVVVIMVMALSMMKVMAGTSAVCPASQPISGQGLYRQGSGLSGDWPAARDDSVAQANAFHIRVSRSKRRGLW
jgi:hypothetical protein